MPHGSQRRTDVQIPTHLSWREKLLGKESDVRDFCLSEKCLLQKILGPLAQHGTGREGQALEPESDVSFGISLIWCLILICKMGLLYRHKMGL